MTLVTDLGCYGGEIKHPISIYLQKGDCNLPVFTLRRSVHRHAPNILEFGKWGLNYLRDEEFRATHERTTDLMPVYHGLGSQIYQYAYFVRRDPSCQSCYEAGKDFMDKYYLTDIELLTEIRK